MFSNHLPAATVKCFLLLNTQGSLILLIFSSSSLVCLVIYNYNIYHSDKCSIILVSCCIVIVVYVLCRVFCVGCVELMVSPAAVSAIKKAKTWTCFLCTPHHSDTHGLLLPRHSHVSNDAWYMRMESFCLGCPTSLQLQYVITSNNISDYPYDRFLPVIGFHLLSILYILFFWCA